MERRRVIVVVFILAGVFLPLWLFVSKKTVHPPDDLLSSPLSEVNTNQRDEHAPLRNTTPDPSAVMAVRLPPPPLLSTPAFKPVMGKSIRISAMQASEANPPRPRSVAALAPPLSMQKKRTEPKMTALKPKLQEMATREKKSFRTLRPTPARTRTPPKTKYPSAQTTEQKFKDQTVEVRVHPLTQEVRKGRKLLKLLEHGKGPAIEIAWPRSERERTHLFGYLNTCFGMRTALMDKDGQLYVEGGKRGRRWEINLDQFSWFVRRPDGFISPPEHRAAEKVRSYHGLIPAAHVVRVFPRVVDAALLGGLKRLMGEAYSRSRTIRGHYRKTPAGLVVDTIVYEGGTVFGAISFPPVGGPAC